MKTLMKSVLGGALALGMTQAAFAETQGVTDSEIVIGSANDLSGIFAAVGVPAINGANLKIKEVNEAGGVHGRQIRFVVEDHTYQLPKAAQAFNKLVNRDKVFAMMLTLGTPHNLAGFKILDPKGIPNLNPLSAAREMLSEPIDNKYTGFASYYDQTVAGIKYLNEQFGHTNVCAMYLPTDFGIEIATAAKESTESLGTTFVSETTHKPDEQDFVGAVQKLRSENCEVIVMALGVRAGITVVGTAKQLGWTEAKFLNTSAGFLEPVAAVPNGVTEGLYAAAGWVDLAARAADPVPAAFIKAYEEEYGQPASGFAMLGYNAAETLVMALEAAGPDLTHESFQKGMESVDFYSELLDTRIAYGPGDHQGADEITISIVEGGKWKLLARQ